MQRGGWPTCTGSASPGWTASPPTSCSPSANLIPAKTSWQLLLSSSLEVPVHLSIGLSTERDLKSLPTVLHNEAAMQLFARLSCMDIVQYSSQRNLLAWLTEAAWAVVTGREQQRWQMWALHT